VLRISRVDDHPSETTLLVEGRIVSEWVAVLEDQCRDALRAPRRVRLDLSGVAFVDPRGVELLQRLAGERLILVNCSELVDALLKENER
jgi:ABC-type transporter Mla MlaB component